MKVGDKRMNPTIFLEQFGTYPDPDLDQSGNPVSTLPLLVEFR